MTEFRICKNKYEWFKIQLWYPRRKILGVKLKGKWKDTCFTSRSRKCRLFKTFLAAKQAKSRMTQQREELNNEWTEIEERD